jgi:hypothetical protein
MVRGEENASSLPEEERRAALTAFPTPSRYGDAPCGLST